MSIFDCPMLLKLWIWTWPSFTVSTWLLDKNENNNKSSRKRVDLNFPQIFISSQQEFVYFYLRLPFVLQSTEFPHLKWWLLFLSSFLCCLWIFTQNDHLLGVSHHTWSWPKILGRVGVLENFWTFGSFGFKFA